MTHILTRSRTTNLSERVKALELEKKKLQIQVRNLTSEINELSKTDSKILNDKWLEDFHLDAYFDAIYNEVSRHNADISLAGPSLTQLLKSGNEVDVIQTLADISFYSANIAFFCVSNCMNNEYIRQKDPVQQLSTRSSHWSLLVCSKNEQTFYHIDSIRRLNHSNAKILAKNINSHFDFEEVVTVQQTSNFECGLHVLVNMKYIINQILKTENIPFIGLITNMVKSVNSNTSTRESLENLNLVPKSTANDPLFMVSENEVDYTITNFDSATQMKNNLSEDSEPNFKKARPKHGVYKKIAKEEKFQLKCINRFSCLNNESSTAMEINSYVGHCNDEKDYRNSIKINQTNRKINQNVKFFPNDSNYDVICLEEEHDQSLNNKSTNKKKSKEHKVSLTFDNFLQRSESNKLPPSHNKNFESLKLDSTNILSDENIYRVKLIADSHGRFLREAIVKCSNKNSEVSAIIKPNGKVCHVLTDLVSESENFSCKDFVIIMAGTNDINKNTEMKLLVDEFEKTIKKCANTNIILSALPYRYDAPYLNSKIMKLNKLLENLANKFFNVYFLQLSELNRDCYTFHGLHLNKLGKYKLASMIKNLMNYILNDGKHIIPVRLTTGWFHDQQSKNKYFLEKGLALKKPRQ